MSQPSQFSSIGWANVDKTPEVAARYLDMLTKLLGDLKKQTMDWMRLKPGMSALDVGCGVGRDAEALAARVGPTGRVVGIDASQELIGQATQRTASLGLPLRFHVDDAQAMAFPDNSFDAARVDRVLQHLPDPAQAVREMARVVKPGGRIVALEPDWESVSLGGVDIAVSRAWVRHHVDVSSAQGTMGRELKRLFKDVGARDLEIHAGTVVFETLAHADQVMSLRANLDGARNKGWITGEQAENWWRGLEALDREDKFYASMNSVTVGATV